MPARKHATFCKCVTCRRKYHAFTYPKKRRKRSKGHKPHCRCVVCKRMSSARR